MRNGSAVWSAGAKPIPTHTATPVAPPSWSAARCTPEAIPASSPVTPLTAMYCSPTIPNPIPAAMSSIAGISHGAPAFTAATSPPHCVWPYPTYFPGYATSPSGNFGNSRSSWPRSFPMPRSWMPSVAGRNSVGWPYRTRAALSRLYVTIHDSVRTPIGSIDFVATSELTDTMAWTSNSGNTRSPVAVESGM